jgi:hypothetical protein
MAKVDVPHYTCDWPGCPEKWPIYSKNESMLLIFAVHTKIIAMRGGQVVLKKNVYNFCKCHALEVKEILGMELLNARWHLGPELKEDMGCWVNAWIIDGNPDQLVFDHQLNYKDLEKIYYFFIANILSPKNGEQEVKVYV